MSLTTRRTCIGNSDTDEAPQVDDGDDDDDDDYGSGPADDDDEGDDGAAGATPRLTRSRNPGVTAADWREVFGAHDAGKRNKTIRVVTCHDVQLQHPGRRRRDRR